MKKNYWLLVLAISTLLTWYAVLAIASLSNGAKTPGGEGQSNSDLAKTLDVEFDTDLVNPGVKSPCSALIGDVFERSVLDLGEPEILFSKFPFQDSFSNTNFPSTIFLPGYPESNADNTFTGWSVLAQFLSNESFLNLSYGFEISAENSAQWFPKAHTTSISELI